jgi:streptogramin lyase
MTEYPATTPSPLDITAGPDGALWFTDGINNKIGRMTTAGTATVYTVHTANGYPFDITTRPDGQLWFPEYQSGYVGRMTVLGSMVEYPAYATIKYIAAGSDGALWMTRFDTNWNILRITTYGALTKFTIPGGMTPEQITAGPDGSLWFDFAGSNHIGSISTTGVFSDYVPQTPFSGAGGIAAARDGAIWFTEPDAGQIGRITTKGTISEYPLPIFANPNAIAAGPDGALWFTEGAANRIGRLAY